MVGKGFHSGGNSQVSGPDLCQAGNLPGGLGPLPVESGSLKAGSFQGFAAADCDRAGERLDLHHVTGRSQGDSQAASLADGETLDSGVHGQHMAFLVNDLARAVVIRPALAHKVQVIVVRHEADLLAFGLVMDR